MISALAAADALAVIPEADDSLPAGAEVELWWLDRRLMPRRDRPDDRRTDGPETAAPRDRAAPADPRRPGGRPRMVDVSAKPVTARRAVAEALVAVSPETMSLVIDGGGPKGDVLGVAELAGVMGGKRTSDLIPLCHPLALTDLVVAITPDRAAGVLRIRAEAATTGPDRRRDGGDDRGVGRRADGLRHGQGRRARRRDPRPSGWSPRPAARAATWERHDGRPADAAGAARRDPARRPVGRPDRARSARASADERRRPARSALVITASDGAAAGVREDTSGDGARGAPARRSGSRSSGPSSPTTSRRSRRALRRRRRAPRPRRHDRRHGLTPRDVTPQATLAVIDYEVPGLAEAMRAAGRATTPLADLSRGVVGVARADARS